MRYGCPVPGCGERFAKIGDKKRHLKDCHPKDSPCAARCKPEDPCSGARCT